MCHDTLYPSDDLASVFCASSNGGHGSHEHVPMVGKTSLLHVSYSQDTRKGIASMINSDERSIEQLIAQAKALLPDALAKLEFKYLLDDARDMGVTAQQLRQALCSVIDYFGFVRPMEDFLDDERGDWDEDEQDEDDDDLD